MILRELFKDHCLRISRSFGSCLLLFIQRLIQILISRLRTDHPAPLVEGTLEWVKLMWVPNSISSGWGQRSNLETRFSEEVELLLPGKGQIRETASDRALESYSGVLGLLRHAWRSKLSSLKLHKLRAVFLACGHTCQDTVAKKDGVLLIWKFAHAQCLHCAVQCHYSFFFFPFMPDSWYS